MTSNPTRVRRLNLRAVLVLSACVVVAAASLLALNARRGRSGRQALLKEARACRELQHIDLALAYLDRCLALDHGDLEALEIKADILAGRARSEEQITEAIAVHTLLLGLDPENPSRNQTRTRLAELNLRIPGRARAAEALARELLRRGDDNAVAHRLLAESLEAAGRDGDRDALQEALREYEAARRLDPRDEAAAVRLSALLDEPLKRGEDALRVLDDLVATNRDQPRRLASAYLARARFHARRRERDQTRAELDRAAEAAVDDPEIRLDAAEIAVGVGDVEAGRKFLRGLSDAKVEPLRVKLVEGRIDYLEHRPDDAVHSWREGLLLTGGSDADLTWRLASMLIDSGRVEEAEPLISQFRRLVGGVEAPPTYRYLRGFAYLKSNRPAEAVVELEAIRNKVDPSLEGYVYFLLGQAHEAMRDSVKAVDAYRHAVRLLNDAGDAWIAIARLLADDRPNEAASTLEQGLQTLPNDPKLLVAIAQAAWRRQLRLPPASRSWTELEAAIERARNVAANSVDLALVQADLAAARDGLEQADAVLAAAARVNPRAEPLWIARARSLALRGRAADALELLDQAVAVAGPIPDFFVARTSILLAQGRRRDARDTLENALEKVPQNRRAPLWKALGELDQGRGDLPAARRAYEEWARALPEDPKPRAALVAVALARGDDREIRAAVDALKPVGNANSPAWRLARVEELLHTLAADKPAATPNKADLDARRDEARRWINELHREYPQLAAPYVLEGRLSERLNKPEDAVQAYRRALELDPGSTALRPLVALLVRLKKDRELADLAKSPAAVPGFQELAAVEALKQGDDAFVEQLAARLVETDPRAVDLRLWQARVLNTLGKPAEAEAVLRALISRRPRDPNPRIALMLVQISQKQAREAAATFEELRAQAQADRPELLWAQCCRILGDAPRADEFFRAAARLWPDDMTVAETVVAHFEAAGRPNDVEAVTRDVLARRPGLGWATRRLAVSLARRDHDPAAWNEALALVGPEPRGDDNADDRLARAQVYALSPIPKHHARAVAILEELNADIPGSVALHELLARLLLRQGRPADARPHAALVARPDNATPDQIALYASTLTALRELDEADRQYKRLVALHPNNPAAFETQARILHARDHNDQALQILDDLLALKIREHAPDALAIGARCLGLASEFKRPDDLRRLVQRLETLGPTARLYAARFLNEHADPDAARALAETALKSGDARAVGRLALELALAQPVDQPWLDLADRSLSHALAADPDDVDLLWSMSLVRHTQRRYDDEVALYKAMIAAKPKHLDFLNNLAWTLSEGLRRPAEALVYADQAVAALGRRPGLLDTRGTILLRLGRIDEAVRDLEEAARGAPSASVWFHLARAYQAAQRHNEFHAARDRALHAGLSEDSLEPGDRAAWDSVMKAP